MDIPKLHLQDRIFALCPGSKKENLEENAEKVLVAGSTVLIWIS